MEMSKGWKIFLWVLLILVALAAIAFFWGKSAWDKLSFSRPVLQALNLNGLTATDLVNIALSGQSKTVTATVAMDVKNDNSFSIPFSVKIKLLYQDTIIAETSSISGTVPANGILRISDAVNIILNNAGGAILGEKVQGKPVQLDYTVSLRLFGIPVPKTIKNSFLW